MARAVVLAGAPNTGPLAEIEPVPNEALVRVGGKPLISWVADALQEATQISEVVVVGPEHELSPHISDDVTFVEPRGSLMGNVRAGIEAVDRNERILLCTSDIPLITGEIVDRFLDQCSELEADFYYPVIEKKVAEVRFPEAQRTWVATADGTFTGGNMLLIQPDKVLQSLQLAEKFTDARKSPLKLAMMLGPVFILKLLLRRLTVTELERKVSSLAGCQAKAVFTPDPEIGFDVDKPKHIEAVERALSDSGYTW